MKNSLKHLFVLLISLCCTGFLANAQQQCNAAFTFQPDSSGLEIHFDNNSTSQNAITSHSWTFGDGTSSTAKDPHHTYTTAGIYNVCLTINVTTPNGLVCTDTQCDSIRVGQSTPAPTCQANFSFQLGTNSNTVYFNNTSTGSNTVNFTSAWDFGDNTTSTQKNPVHTYSAAGTYNVCLISTVAFSGGTTCTDTTCKTVVVGNSFPPCQAYFSFTIDSTGLGVNFTDHSQTQTATFGTTWVFGDGDTSTAFNPHHTYDSAGTYTVCLYLAAPISGLGCLDTFCKTIVVGGPAPCIDSNQITLNCPCPTVYNPVCGCDGNTYTNDCNARCHGVTRWTPGACGSSGCQASFNFQTAAGTSKVYFNNTSFANNTTGTSQWSFGDGHNSTDKNPMHTYAGPGTYYVCLTISVVNNNGTACTSTKCDSVTVGGVLPCIDQSLIDPNANCPTQYNPVCGCDGVTYSNSCMAKFGHGVTTWTQGACQNTGCNAGFTVSIQTGFSAKFNNTSHGNTSTSTFTSRWDFGDNTTSTDRNPQHTYLNAGVYYVCLTITSNTVGATCTDTFCDSVRIGQNAPCIDQSLIDPNVACPAVYQPVCGCNGVTYSNDCVAKFGHGVTHWTSGPCGGTGTCNASFNYQVTLNGGVQFTNTSSPNPQPVNFSSLWSFGDGTTSTDKSPYHAYNGFGKYYVCLTITVPTSAGTVCTSTFCDSVLVGVNAPCIDPSLIDSSHGCTQIYQPVCGCDGVTYGNSCEAMYHHGVTRWTPGACGTTNNCDAKFTWNYGIVPPTVFFTDNSTGNHVIGWHWDFGDGTSSTLRNPAHNFPQSGPYVVCLTITCASTNSGGVSVDTYCDTVIGIGTVCVDSAQIDTTQACPTQYAPVCGCDGNTYANACIAKYHHGVTTWNPGACPGSGCQSYFSFQLSATGYAVSFTDHSQGTPTSWRWDFGDNSSSTDQNPVHTYLTPGNYNVCLTITTTNQNGTACTSTFCKVVVIHGCINPALILPTAPCPNQYQPVCGCDSVTYANACIAQKRHGVTSWTPGPCHSTCQASFTTSHPTTGNQIQFTNTSTGNFTRVKWNFGDGSTATVNNPVHVYDVTGWYRVCLEIASNNNTCYSQICDSVYATGCTDPALINPSVTCPTVSQPVCGCDGQTYVNSCVAQYQHGIVAFTPGPCAGQGYCPTSAQDQHKVWIKRVGPNMTGDNNGYAYFNQCQRKFRAGRTYIMPVNGAVNNLPNFQAHWRVWFDFNHDNDFTDAGELVWQGFGALNQFAVFTVPLNACAGCTRMRVTLSDNFQNECGNYAVGETEDYDVGIRSTTLCHATPNHQMAAGGNVSQFQFKADEYEAGEEFADLYEALEFSIFPNPAEDVANIILSAGDEKEITIRVFDISGKEVFNKNIDNLETNTTLQLQTSELANGVYQVAVQTGNGFRSVQKLIVAR